MQPTKESDKPDVEEGKTMIELNTKHFELLRIAKLRNLKVRRMSENVFAVTSFTRRSDGLEWVIADGVCSCPARGYCTHRASAVDYFFNVEAHPALYDAYTLANSNDRLQLRLRIRAGELSRSDKTYVRFAMKVYERKRAAVKSGADIKRVESVTPTGKRKVKEYARGIQI